MNCRSSSYHTTNKIHISKNPKNSFVKQRIPFSMTKCIVMCSTRIRWHVQLHYTNPPYNNTAVFYFQSIWYCACVIQSGQMFKCASMLITPLIWFYVEIATIISHCILLFKTIMFNWLNDAFEELLNSSSMNIQSACGIINYQHTIIHCKCWYI